MIIHQVYGLFDDGKEMNVLFKTGSEAWKKYCDRNNHIYKMWNKKECDELVNTYTNIKNYYYDVKYPVMKVDIVRFLIIYQFGGMYVDLDVLPFKDNINIDESKLSLCNYLWTPNGEVKKKTIADIEILSAPKQYLPLWEFIALYVPKQIKEKDEIEVYKDWKIRYIFQTTGPPSFRRFMKIKKMTYNTIDTLGLPKEVSINDEINIDNYGGLDYDCLSYFSLSYNPHGNKNVQYRKKKGM